MLIMLIGFEFPQQFGIQSKEPNELSVHQVPVLRLDSNVLKAFVMGEDPKASRQVPRLLFAFANDKPMRQQLAIHADLLYYLQSYILTCTYLHDPARVPRHRAERIHLGDGLHGGRGASRDEGLPVGWQGVGVGHVKQGDPVLVDRA